MGFYLLGLWNQRAVSAQFPPASDPIPLAARVIVISKIQSAVTSYFGHWDSLEGVDWQTEFQTYVVSAIEAKDRFDFDLETLKFIARLHNKHTQFQDQWLWEHHGQTLGFGVLRLEDKWLVAWSRDQRLKKGDIVLAVGKQDISQFIREKSAFVNASSKEASENLVFDRPFLFPHSFDLKLGSDRIVTITRGDTSHHIPDGGSSESSEKWSKGRWLRKSEIGYLKIPSFNQPDFENTAIDWMEKFHRVLVNRFTCSACEDFVMPFKDNGRAILVGKTTEGSSGQPYFQNLGDGMTIMVGAERHSFPDGAPFEGVGIKPHRFVVPTMDDLMSGTDPVLALAETLVESTGN